MRCKICEQETERIFKLKVLNKYDVAYFQCKNCGFIQTERPFWLKEAYSEAVSALDTGVISRNLALVDLTTKIIYKSYDFSEKFLDYGGGYGIFVRLMRDRGFDFYRYDKHCSNLFAKYKFL